MNNENYILIADSHLRPGGEDAFFDMLDRIRQYRPAGVIFLGDIFELWVALNGYESDIHFRFLQWCREAKEQFEVGFIVGNHEFYLTRSHSDAFSWLEEKEHTLKDSGVRVLHGDLIDRSDWGYRLLRAFLRNPVTWFLLKITGRTIGPKVADHVRVSLKPTNQLHKRFLPMPYLKEYSENTAKQKLKKIFAGHFHQHKELDFPEGIPLEILPAWEAAGEIILLGPGLKSVCGPWQDILKCDPLK